MQLTQLSFRAMGTNVHVIIGGSVPAHAAVAQARVQVLEQLWSRFIDDSEISRINASPGVALPVSPETLTLFERAIESWEMTRGLFDPMVLADLIALGYDRSFGELRTLPPQSPSQRGSLDPQPLDRGRTEIGITIDRTAMTVAVDVGRGFDSGGIGKGLAADIVVASLLEAGAPGAMANLGGDLRTGGEAPENGWLVAIDNPFDLDGPPVARFRLDGQALVTTSSQGRRWLQGESEHHHLLNPATGQPALSDVASVTVIADEGWRAEALSKAAFLSGCARAVEMLPEHGATGMVVGRDGVIDWIAGSREFRVPDRVVARRQL
ncbi:MAG: FAD:protein FMN transferase [Actinomycetota bacterium]